MRMNLEKYKVVNTINLKDFSTKEVEENAKKELKKIRKKLSELQDTMYAEGKYGVLICLQGMDTSGKDSLIERFLKM